MITRMEFDGVDREIEICDYEKTRSGGIIGAIDAYFIDDGDKFEPLTEDQLDKLNERGLREGWD